MYSYLDLLALFGIGSAHPGGLDMTKRLLRRVPIHAASRVLDAGCGTGRTALFLAEQYGCAVTGVERHPIMLEKAQKRIESAQTNVTLVRGDIENLPLDANTFDVALTESVLAFTIITKSLAELHRVLQPGGYVVSLEMTVERPLLFTEHQELVQLYGAQEYLTEAQWLYHFKETGFRDVRILEGSTVKWFSHQEKPEFDISPSLHPSLYDIWSQHEKVLRKYGHILGHRVFVCRK